MDIKQILKKYSSTRIRQEASILLTLIVHLLFSFSGHAQDFETAPKENDLVDMSSSIASLNELCEAIKDGNTDAIMQLSTIEGYEAIVSSRGLLNLQIDVLFWQEAIVNGRVLITEKIESEREFVLLSGKQPYEILCIHSNSSDRLMLLEKLTFIYEEGKWKFFIFSERERE